MEEQAGIYQFTLIENKGVSITYNTDGSIRVITNTGDELTIENSDCDTIQLDYSFTHRRSGNNKLQYRNTISWNQIGLNDSNLDLINQIKQSIYGWIVLIEFYNKEQKIILNPFRFRNSAITNISNHYNIELQNVIFGKRILDYNPLAGTVTADSNTVTADSNTVDTTGGTI